MAFRITSDADMLALSAPAGLEHFFRDAGRDLAAASAATGQTILGPPLSVGDLIPAELLAPHRLPAPSGSGIIAG
jgi:hypothetical protein